MSSPSLDYETLSIKWWQWIEHKDPKYQPVGIVFLPGMTGGSTEHTISAKAGDRLFFSPAKYLGLEKEDDIDDKVNFQVEFDDLQVICLGRIKTTKTFTSTIAGPNSISDGYWYISEPLKLGCYQGITQGRIPSGNFSEKTKYKITMDYETLSINWWQWIEDKQNPKYQPDGIVFLPGMTGGNKKYPISAKAGDRLFFSPAKYLGLEKEDDIDDKVNFEVAFGELQVIYLGRIKTTKTFTSITEGQNSICDGHWYISEPLKPGRYYGITQGRIPSGDFSEKTEYDVTVN